MGAHKKRFCPQGHDTHVVGRAKGTGECKRCHALKFKQKQYGIPIDEYNRRLLEQNGVCAICHKPESVRHFKSKTVSTMGVDHNHETGKVRGLLCFRCNMGLGYFQDAPLLLREAARYLEKASVR